MSKEDICFISAYDMREKIKTQELTSLEITEMIIERIEKINPIIHAFCTPTFDLARETAKKADDAIKKGEKIGILHGVPTSIKDLVDTKGIRTTYGCKIFEHNVPKKDEVVVERLKNAGMVFLGKTNTPEFGHLAISYNRIFEETRNPWNLERTPGGSSSGAAAAVASGLSPLALGSDGGGSIRIPSSLCGVYGLKPNFGRIPRDFKLISFYLLSHYGPIVRYVRDAALMLDAMKGPSDADKFSLQKTNINYVDIVKETPRKLKIGYSLDLGYAKAINPEVEKSVLEAVHKFENFDWQVEKANLRLKKSYQTVVTLVTTGYAYDFKPYLKDWKEKMTPSFLKMIEAGFNYTPQDLVKAEYVAMKFYEQFYEYFKEYDILITPTIAITAFELGKSFPEQIEGKSVSPAAWMPFTYPFNMSGHPAASIPCGWSSEGLPIGMQIVGRRFDEATVLQVSKAFEEIAPWQEKIPNIQSWEI
ncbi:MAG: amidase [Candidatus Thorarchaeota archaeon]